MTSLIPTNIQVPAHLAKRVGQQSALMTAMSGGLAGDSFPRISIKGARFRIIDGGSETVLDSTTLDVIIVGVNPKLSKTWYARQWTPDSEPAAPDCFSLNGVGPHPDSTSPQNDLCATCKQNQWGSKVTPQGQEIKACADQKRLAVVAANDPDGPVYLLQVTPAALKGLNIYHKELKARGFSPEIVRTKVSFDTDASFPKLKFAFAGFVDETASDVVDRLIGSDRVLEITGESQSAAAVPVAQPEPVKPKPLLVREKPEPVAPVKEEPATPKRGFMAEKAPVEKPAPVTKRTTKPAAPVEVSSADALAKEIQGIMDNLDADD